MVSVWADFEPVTELGLMLLILGAALTAKQFAEFAIKSAAASEIIRDTSTILRCPIASVIATAVLPTPLK